MSHNLITRATENALKLQTSMGKGQFGFAMQALFALIMGKLGAKIIRVNPTGHPDIVLEHLGTHALIEVEVVGRERNTFELTQEDYLAIRPSVGAKGYVVILDMHEPVGWHVIDVDSLSEPSIGTYSLSELAMREEKQLTANCNFEFYKAVTESSKRIAWLRFEGIRKRSLNGVFSLN